MFAPQRARCGIRDYTDLLIAHLRDIPDVTEIAMVAPPPAETSHGLTRSFLRYAPEERRYHALGRAMNAGDLAHVQHQYFFFGGVAPHRNHARAFYAALRVPLVVTVHEIVLPEAQRSALTRHLVALANRQNFLHPAIRACIVHTEQDAQHLQALGVPADRITRIPHGTPPPCPLPDVQTAKQRLECQGRFVVTLFGFLSAKKGHMLALEALAAMPPDTLLLLAGDRHPDDRTGYVALLDATIARRGLTDRVRITGYLPAEEIPWVMAATDAGIAPYTQTSGSGSLANLLAYGRAVVASDIPPHREIADASPAPLRLFRAGNAQDLAHQLLVLRENPTERMALEQAARAYARSHSYARMAQETAAVYRRLLAEPDHAHCH